MHSGRRIALTFGLLAIAQAASAQQRVGLTVAPLTAGPVAYETGEGMNIRVVVVAQGLEYP